jgi:hypothetical protein
MRDVLIGQTDYTVLVRITGADGAPETGLAHTDIDIAYSRVETDNDVTTADVAPADLANLTAAHSDWGWEEVSSGDHPGLYRLDIADAVFASGAWEAVVTITDASGSDFYAHDIGFRLVAFNAQDGVRLGLTALPNAAADAAGGLPISDAGGLDLDAKIGALTFTVAGDVDVNVQTWGGTAISTPPAVNATQISGDTTAADNAEAFFDGTGYAGTNNVIPTVTTTTTATNVTTVNGLAAGVITAASIAADAITDAKVASDVTIASVTGAVGSVTGNVGGNVAGSVGSVTGAINTAAGVITTLDALDTAQDTQHSTTQTAVADVPTNAELATALGTADDAVLAAIAALNNLSSAGAQSAVTTALTAALTEGYRGTGATGSVRDLLYEIVAHLGESTIASTTKTLKKLDGSTTAKTYTLNDSVTPTAITETT